MNNAGYQGQASLYSYDMRNSYPVYFRVVHGGRLYVGAMGKGSGQRRNLQNDFTSIQYPNWRDDWIPEWYQTEPKRR